MKIGRLGFYISVIVFAVVVWRSEVFIQNRPQVYGELISDLSPLQEKQLGAFLEMNRLLITLGTALLGAMGFLLVNTHKARSSARQLSPAFASAFFVGLSVYYGYRAYEDLSNHASTSRPHFRPQRLPDCVGSTRSFLHFPAGRLLLRRFCFSPVDKGGWTWVIPEYRYPLRSRAIWRFCSHRLHCCRRHPYGRANYKSIPTQAVPT